MRLSSSWRHVYKSPEERKDLEAQLVVAEPALKKLRSVIKNKEHSLFQNMKQESNFTYPAWQEHQAYQLGYLKALDDIVDLIKFIGE